MLVGASDANTNSASLLVDWLHMTPYPGSGVFQSRVFDAGSVFDWTTLSSNSTLPGGTSIAIETRTGNVASPDGSWSPWSAVSGGTIASPNGRYIQYRATLSTSDTSRTPVLEQVSLNGVEAPTNTAPSANPDTFSTVEDTALVLPASGAGSPAANDTDIDGDTLTVTAVSTPSGGTVSLSAGSITFNPAANLCGVGAGSFSYTVSDGHGGTAVRRSDGQHHLCK